MSSPLDRSKRFTLFAFPGRPVHSDTNSASPGSILVRQQLRAKTKSLTCPPLSIARYSFIQLSQLGPQWRERKCQIFETVAKGDSNPGSLDCESGILPLSYRAPCNIVFPFMSLCGGSLRTEMLPCGNTRMSPSARATRGQDNKRFSSMSRCSTHNLCSEMT